MAHENRKTLLLIDSNSLMHRAFHGIRQPMTAPDGRATNALYGFFNMFIKLMSTYEPDYVVCAFDKGKPTIRIEMLEDYKAHRPPMDPLLREQFPMVKELLTTLEIPILEAEGWEGDDVLGTLATQGEAQGLDVLVVTGDRDMYQLSTEYIHIVATKKGVSDVAIMDPQSVEDLYHGIGPDLIPDFYGLKGDTSDNIPGVPKIGPKTAAALLLQYETLENLIAHADEVPGKVGENLRAHIDDALLSKKLATILTNAPVELNLEQAAFPQYAMDHVVQAFSALGFTNMLSRFGKLVGVSSSEVKQLAEHYQRTAQTVSAQTSTPEHSITTIRTHDAAFEQLEKACAQKIWVSAVLEHKQAEGALFADTHMLWVCDGTVLMAFVDDEITEALTHLVLSGYLVNADIKQLLKLVVPSDSSEPCQIDPFALDYRRIFDLGLCGYLLESDASTYDIESLTARFLTSTYAVAEGASEGAKQAVATYLLKEPLEELLKKDGCFEVYQAIELPLLLSLLRCERRGLALDCDVLRQQSHDLAAEIDELSREIYTEAGNTFNIDSPQQLSHVLFDVLKLPTFGLKKTKRGYWSTNAKILADLAEDHRIVAEVLDYRERSKIKSTYLDALPTLISADGRVHTTFNQTIAATGRLSSSDPNLQNIPTRSELGHRVRQAFTVAPDHVFLACDYSQIELRLLAHLSGDEHLIDAFLSGADFHAATAARVFGVSLDEVTPALRSRAKAVNFGIVYGQQAFGLSQTLKIPRAEAQAMIDRYFSAYPGVRSFLDDACAWGRSHGWVQTIYGRKRHIKEFAQSNKQLIALGERVAMNHPMQGTAADIIKIAMVQVEQKLAEAGLNAQLILQIHDELDFEVPITELEAVSQLVKETMEAVCTLKVPLIAEVSYGKNWAEAK